MKKALFASVAIAAMATSALAGGKGDVYVEPEPEDPFIAAVPVNSSASPLLIPLLVAGGAVAVVAAASSSDDGSDGGAGGTGGTSGTN
ncbi:hypothetical protein [Cognatishimia sp. F0-27]|uniref:hypothetical protein n=1 Tax=Cognatishimia sp. F0-27 TaxID=2816855 RepID=UPI001D0C8395|nr:hypothetical protein [Cognatishimia sp. F0-27]MCC1493336.1 hypothetical protein [Cognatishimia sp. F0-27]